MSKTSIKGVYFKNLSLSNVKCFQGEYHIDFSEGGERPVMWTVILGNNNTGKTTLLRCLADLEPMVREGVTWEEIANNQEGRFETGSFDSRFIRRLNSENEDSRQFMVPGRLKNGKLVNFLTWGADLFTWDILGSFHSLGKENSPVRLSSFLNAMKHFVDSSDYPAIQNFLILGYGTNRMMSQASLSDDETFYPTQSLFDQNTELLNVEEWLLQTDYAVKNNNPRAQARLDKIKSLLTSKIFPDIEDFRFVTTDNFKNFVEVQTPYGWVPMRELGYGYQASIAWLGDLARRMFDRYPNSENPFQEAAIVLVDEIDLHLHPEWQRKIIGFLSDTFPNVQFIVTAHSPLIVQSADKVNVVLLEKNEGEGVSIRQPDLNTFKGWTVEEILNELMGLGERTHSDAYLSLMKEFEDGLDEGDYHKAHQAYDELDKILHPRSVQRKLLQIQMAPLTPG